MVRVLVRCPPSHSAEQSPQSTQSPITHPRGGGKPHVGLTASPFAGLHCETSLRDSSEHVLPFPDANCAICRWRSFTPKHEQLQSVHSVQADSLQSMSESQSPAEHFSYSSSSPVGATPQSFGGTPISRCRDLYPSPQVAEHCDQALHSAQLPSTQVLHG